MESSIVGLPSIFNTLCKFKYFQKELDERTQVRCQSKRLHISQWLNLGQRDRNQSTCPPPSGDDFCGGRRSHGARTESMCRSHWKASSCLKGSSRCELPLQCGAFARKSNRALSQNSQVV